MATVLISLVGGRPVPNIMLALQQQPERLYLIVSRDSVGVGRDYEKTLAALPTHLQPALTVIVAPYRLQETITACQMLIAKHRDDTIIVNTTLGPKTMAFGAYDAAKAAREQGVNVEVCYLAREGLVCLFADTITPVQIAMHDYFASYGWDVSWKSDPRDDRLPRLTQLLTADLALTQRLIQVLRARSGGKGRRTCRAKQRFDDAEFRLLQSIEAAGLLEQVRRDEHDAVWIIPDQVAGQVLLSGDWLEFLVYQSADGLTNQSGEHLFDTCGWGVEDRSGKGEIDFAGMYQGQILIASCKTEDQIRRGWFEDLHSKMQQLGKGMCSGLLVSTVSRNTRTAQDLEDYQKWASERQIVLVLAEDLPQLPAILKKVALVDGKLPPQELTVYARI